SIACCWLKLEWSTFAMFSEIDGYLDGYDGDKAYEAVKKLISESISDRIGLYCRFAHACYIRSNNCFKNLEKCKAILGEAHEACKKAYELDAKNKDVLKWCSIISGSLADISDGEEKIELGYEFKNYIDEAIKITPDSSIYHMRGRFTYEVANLSQTKPMMASKLFGNTSTIYTFDEALKDLLKAEALNPRQLDNLLFIAKCFLAKGDKVQAHHYLMLMNECSLVDEADEVMMVEANDLLKMIDDESNEETAKENSLIESAVSDDEREDMRLNDSIEEEAGPSDNEMSRA
uniref:Gamma-soluble NSF attachment protein n=2 Tax=Parascaris univalens TaxID=6257 RepID=A0A915B6T7_PARUN